MKILAISVTFYPDKELFERSVSSFVDFVDEVLVWENTPKEEAAEYRLTDGMKHSEKIHYLGEGRNVGISRALNFALKNAIKGGYDYMLTMDQDSIWEGFDKFLLHIAEDGGKHPGIYAPVHKEMSIPETFSKTDWLITSGMLAPVSTLDRLGGYCEQFAIDAIDAELSCRAEENGVSLYYIKDCRLWHRLGDPQKKKFLWKTYTLNDYPPFRLYGIYRNYIITIRKHPECIWLRRSFLKGWIRQAPIRIFLGSKHRLKSLWSIFKGIIDGLFYNMKNFRLDQEQDPEL